MAVSRGGLLIPRNTILELGGKNNSLLLIIIIIINVIMIEIIHCNKRDNKNNNFHIPIMNIASHRRTPFIPGFNEHIPEHFLAIDLCLRLNEPLLPTTIEPLPQQHPDNTNTQHINS